MKRKLEIIFILINFLIFAFISSFKISNAAEMNISISASSTTVTPGESVTITVTPDSQVSGMDLELTYDSSLFTYVTGTTSLNEDESAGYFSDSNGVVSYIESPTTTSNETKSVEFVFTANSNVTGTGTFEITSTAIVTSDGSMYAGEIEGSGADGVESVETTSVSVTIVNSSTSETPDYSSSDDGPVVDPSSLDMVVGDTDQLTADRDVTWSSTDESVVKVDENGKVTAEGPGNAYIIATDAAGNQTKIPVTVTSNAPVLTPTSATLEVGDTLQIKSDKDISSWTSSNTGVATVDENGLVTAVGVGTATITATDADGNKSTVTITVTSSNSSSSSASSTSSDSSLPNTGEINYGTITFITVLVLAIAIVIIRKKFKKVNFKEEKSDDDK